MKQLNRLCVVDDRNSKEIGYICVYPQCYSSRFLCQKCLQGDSHQHNQQNNLHILDNQIYCNNIKKNLQQVKDNQQEKMYHFEKSIIPLKQIIQVIQNLLNNIQSITSQAEKSKLQYNYIYHLEKQLENVQKYGFNHLDDQSLNNLINIQDVQQDLDIHKKLEDQFDLIIENSLKIKEWPLQILVNNQISQSQKIKDSKYQIQQIEDSIDSGTFTGAISNDLKSIISGGKDGLLKNGIIKQTI